MPRSICDIEQELQALREDEAGLRRQTNYWMNLLGTNPSAEEKLDHVNKLMNNVFDMQKIKIEEIKVLKEMENAAVGRDNQANVKDQSTFHQLLKIVTDPWADLPTSCSTEATRKTLRESVMNFYNLKRNQCMILGTINKKSKHVVTAHIYPKSKPNGLKFFDLNSLDIDNPRNCLRLVKEIEVAFDKKNLTIIEKSGDLRIFLLNKTMLSKQITPASPRTFSSIHGSPLIFNNENRPFRRLLALHCYSSFNNAKSKQQEFLLDGDELDNFVFYVNNLLDVSLNEHKRENVKQWLYDNPVGPAAPLTQSKSTTQFIYDFVEQYTENSSDMSIVKLAVEDLANIVLLDQALFVCNLIINVLKLKPQIAAVVGQLLDSAQKQQIINIDGIANGISSVFEIINGFSDAVWQPLGEIIGTYIGSAQSQSMMNISILTTIMKKVPVQNSKEMIIYIIEYAQKVSSKLKFISLWKLSSLTFDDLLKPDVIDQQFLSAYDWLLNPTSTDDNEIIQQQPTPSLASSSTQVVAASQSSCSSLTNSAYSDADLVKLFRSINEQQVGSNTQKEEINQYIQEKINQYGKYYIVHIVLSYLESCLVHDTIIDRSIATQRIHILNSIIDHDKEKEIQTLYAIQKFIIQLNHPPKMARLLFDVFYDEDCISEKVFLKWLQSPDQEDIDGHNVMIESTKEFFDWLLLAESETTEEDKDDDDDDE